MLELIVFLIFIGMFLSPCVMASGRALSTDQEMGEE